MGWGPRMFRDVKAAKKNTELVVEATFFTKHSVGFILGFHIIWRCLERVLDCLGRSWRFPGGVLGALKTSWGRLGASANRFGDGLGCRADFSSWFEVSWGRQGGVLGLPGKAFLGQENVLETMWHALCILKVCEAPSETDLCWFSEEKRSQVKEGFGCKRKRSGSYRM